MQRKHWELKLIFLILAVVFLAFLAVPAIGLLVKSFLGDNGPTGSYYLDVFTGKGFLEALGNSFTVAAVAALIAGAIVKLWKSGVKDGFGLGIFCVTLVVMLFLNPSPVFVVVLSALAGILWQRMKGGRKE